MRTRVWRLITRAVPTWIGVSAVLGQASCGDQGFFPTTVDRGADFGVANVAFDERYFYCKVEPVLFANSCGGGDASKGDAQGGCHFSATGYRLTDYLPRVSDTCAGGLVPAATNYPEAAQHNYETSQARMKRDPELAPLLQRPTLNQFHPRKIFDVDSADAAAIRQWASRISQ